MLSSPSAAAIASCIASGSCPVTFSSLSLSPRRSEEHTSELQSLMRISYAVFRFKKKKNDRQPALTQDPGYLIAADLKHTNATRLSVSEMQHHTPLAPDHLR